MNKYLKIISYILLTVFLISFSACSKSTNLIEGEWKAQTGATKENKGDLIYYKIEKNGESYTIIFPDKDKNIAIMIQPYSQNDDLYGKVLYAMNKKDQPNYSEYVKKYIN